MKLKPIMVIDDRQVYAVKPWSNHPGDWYLWVVLSRWEGKWVTWMMNTSRWDPVGFGEGHYGLNTLEDALKDFAERGKVFPTELVEQEES